MGLFDKKSGSFSVAELNGMEELLKRQAAKLGISLADLKLLGIGKSCPKYGTGELLHARRVRGGELVVFNISERYRGEKISEGRKKIKDLSRRVDVTSNEKIKNR